MRARFLRTGAVQCWGNNLSGELGLGDRANGSNATPTTDRADRSWRERTRYFHRRRNDVRDSISQEIVTCWGDNYLRRAR